MQNICKYLKDFFFFIQKYFLLELFILPIGILKVVFVEELQAMNQTN